MSKIYSRRRFIIKPKIIGKLPRNKPKKAEKYKRKKIKVFISIGIAITIYILTLRHIGPVFESLCEEEVKSIATIISNQESTKIMNKYQYEELYTIEKDEAGNIVIIKSNVVPINNMISDLAEGIQNRFNENEKTEINIPIGNLLGLYYFSGLGPSMPAKALISGTLDTEIKSEFIAQGINQTLHRIYVNFECYAKIVTPIGNFQEKIINQVIIAEHIIVGNIPETYYNLEGMSGVDDALNVID